MLFLNRWITCKSVQPETCEKIMDTISDRLRIPWLRGAKKVNISILPPLFLLPVFLRVASWHFLLGVVVLTSLPVLALWYYYLTHRRKEQTLFFLSLGLFSLGYMYYVFLQEVVPKGRVGPTRLALLTCGLLLILYALYRAKKNPGYLRNPAHNDRALSGSQVECLNRKGPEKPKGFPSADLSGGLNNRAPKDETKDSPRTSAGSPAKGKDDWCAKCQLVRPARAWHCRICGICVRRMDHHCVWYVGKIWRLAEPTEALLRLAGRAFPLFPSSSLPLPALHLVDNCGLYMVLPLSHRFFELHKFSSFQSFPEGVFFFLGFLFLAAPHFLLTKREVSTVE